MCWICIEFAKETLSPKEFTRNLLELINEKTNDPHLQDIAKVVDALSDDYKNKVETFVAEELLK